MSQIKFKNVSKVYPNGHVGLKNINLNIEKGEFAVIVGLSGAGKSTLLRSVNRLHDITSGEIFIHCRFNFRFNPKTYSLTLNQDTPK